MADYLPVDNNPAVVGYKAARKKYTKKAACGRKYVLVSKLKLWLAAPGVDNTTQARRLLEFAYGRRSPNRPRTPISSKELFHSRYGCVLVFCILLELGCGYLIDQFLGRGIYDDLLPIDLRPLREKTAAMGMGNNADALAEDFNRLQWQFCPVILEMRVGPKLGSDHILPFYKKEKINEKGGTAQLWQIEVPEEFIGPNLVQAVLRNGYPCHDDDLGLRYNFALKTFTEDNKALFENEKEAFLTLGENHAGMVRYLGDYEHVEVHRSTTIHHGVESAKERTTSTWNIILEYGDYDLHEYFMRVAPPVLQSEIGSFWEDLFDVAHAVKGIHHLSIDEIGQMREFNGWHADIKPDNILVVQGQFKLADPGFATFVEKTEAEPKKVLAGGTETYGAPERRRPRRGTDAGAVSQAIDIWSLGCVFSIAATWIALGQEGIREFPKLRQESIRRIIVEQAQHPTRPRLTLGDYFHNGKEVLPNVLGWHMYLRSVLRKSDNITSNVLDLIDEEMLVGDAGRRIKANDLCDRLDRIKSKMQSEAQVPHEAIIEALRTVDAALGEPAMASTTQESTESKKSSTIAGKRQAQKSAWLGAPLKGPARRSEYLKSKLGNSHVGTQRYNLPPIISLGESSFQVQVAQNANVGPSLLNQDSSWIQTDNTSSTGAVETVSNSPSMQPGFLITPGQHSTGTTSKRSTNIPYQDVFQARGEIDRHRKAKFFTKKPAIDKILSRHFKNRDIKFLVDNAQSMRYHWDQAGYLLETLLLKATGQDDNGIDLSFTSGNVFVENSKDISKFTKAMDNPKAQPTEHMNTDMKKSLGEIFSDYISYISEAKANKKEIKNLTLIVLTDGKWDGMDDKDEVGSKIIKFSEEALGLVGELKDRPVSIEFIQFGDDPDATSRLRRLDDYLFPKDRDIVDYEHCTRNVYKMLLGSFIEEFDKIDDDILAPLSPVAESDAGSLAESRRRSSSQPQAGLSPTSRNATVSASHGPDRSSMGPQVQGNASTGGLQRELSSRSHRHSRY